MFTENNETNEMDNERVVDVPGQQVIFPRFEGGVYAPIGKDQFADMNDYAMRAIAAAMGGM